METSHTFSPPQGQLPVPYDTLEAAARQRCEVRQVGSSAAFSLVPQSSCALAGTMVFPTLLALHRHLKLTELQHAQLKAPAAEPASWELMPL